MLGFWRHGARVAEPACTWNGARLGSRIILRHRGRHRARQGGLPDGPALRPASGRVRRIHVPLRSAKTQGNLQGADASGRVRQNSGVFIVVSVPLQGMDRTVGANRCCRRSCRRSRGIVGAIGA